MSSNFASIVEVEADAIRFRRRKIADGTVARLREKFSGKENTPSQSQHFIRSREKSSDKDSTGCAHDLSAIALSGGGIRSAAFSLGVLQAFDRLSEHGEPHLIDAIDYLSTVSGGGYIGTSMVSGMMQPDHTFPFPSLLGEHERQETQYIRNYSNYLSPRGTIDLLMNAAIVIRGLAVNFLLMLPILFIAASITFFIFHFQRELIATNFRFLESPLTWLLSYKASLLSFAVFVGATLVVTIWVSWWNPPAHQRAKVGTVLACALALVLVIFMLELQCKLLSILLENTQPEEGHDFWTLVTPLSGLAGALIVFAQRLANIVHATTATETWASFTHRIASRLLLSTAGLIVPALLWITYTGLCLLVLPRAQSSAPLWEQACPALLILISGIVLLGIGLLTKPNANSLHRLYRDRLTQAFLFDRKALPPPISDAAAASTGGIIGRYRTAPPAHVLLSDLKPRENGNEWKKEAALAPYLLVNTAINLEASNDLKSRGRRADSFIFSPLYVGSRSTGYADTRDMEKAVRDLDLGMAMATSGAAASANMGIHTVRVLTFSLSLLNIRLGYWLANPGMLKDYGKKKLRAGIGPYYFSLETFGLLDEARLNVYLTDGGHIENLGIYELLRRRCKVIVAVDAEADPELTFSSLSRLEVLARIDRGYRINLPWRPVQESYRENIRRGFQKDGSWNGFEGPHGCIGRIDYGNGDHGVLIYIKACLTGDETSYLMDYWRRHPTFPHETTVDQFFSEEQFEAYRCLGFHSARGLLTGRDRFGTLAPPPEGWREEVKECLELLNLKQDLVQKVLKNLELGVAGRPGSDIASVDGDVHPEGA